MDIKLDDGEFHKVYSIDELFAIFQQKPNATYILHGGNTAHGNCEKSIFPSYKIKNHCAEKCIQGVNQLLYFCLYKQYRSEYTQMHGIS